MFSIAVTFSLAAVYGVIVGGPISNQYNWQKLNITPENTSTPLQSSRGIDLPISCGYAVSYINDRNIKNFDVSFRSIIITPNKYFWTFFNWTGGDWTLYVGSQIYGCST